MASFIQTSNRKVLEVLISFSPIDLEAYVRQRAPEIARDIRAAAQKARNEAELVSIIEKVLEKFAATFDVQLNLYKERTVINERMVIELN